MKNARLMTLMFFLLSGLNVHAGGVVGNGTGFSIPLSEFSAAMNRGSGAWVCRDNSGEIKKIELVDLNKAPARANSAMDAIVADNVDAVIENRLTAIGAISPALREVLSRKIQEVKAMLRLVPLKTDIIEGLIVATRPGADFCTNGTNLEYAQLTLKFSPEVILFDPVYTQLPARDQAAMLFREAFELLVPDNIIDTQKIRTQVGNIFYLQTVPEASEELLRYFSPLLQQE